MPYIQLTDNKITGYAIAPPSSELEEWQEVEDSDPELQAYLNAPLLPIQNENWQGLENSLRGSTVWSRAFDAAMRSVAANACMTLLMNSLTSTHFLPDFRFAIKTLRQVMVNQAALADFNEAEIAFIAQTLQDNGFDADYILR